MLRIMFDVVVVVVIASLLSFTYPKPAHVHPFRCLQRHLSVVTGIRCWINTNHILSSSFWLQGNEDKTSNVNTSSESQQTTTSTKSVGQPKNKSSCVIPKIIKEDFDCSCEAAAAGATNPRQRNCCQEQLHPGGAAPASSSVPKSLRLRYSRINGKLRNLNSPTTTSASMAEEQPSITPSKQRMRSHSGPAYPIGFRATTGPVGIPVPSGGSNINRKDSGEQQQQDGSLKTPRLISPNGTGGSFLDNFRYVI